MKQAQRIHRIVAPALEILEAGPITLGGSEASPRNSSMIRACFERWALVPLDFAGVVMQDSQLASCYAAVAKVLTSVDFNDVLTCLESMYRSLITGCYTRYSQFKADYGDYPSRELIAPVNRCVRLFIDEGDYSALADVIQWLRFPAKLSFEMPSLETDALEAFIASEDRIRSIDFSDEYTSRLLDDLNRIMRRWLSGLDLSCPPVRHGSGSVAEGNLSLADKYRALKYSELIDHVCKRQCGSGMQDFSPVPLTQCANYTSRVMFVPKNAKKLRTICMEPATLQFFQQGVMRKLYDFIDSHPYLRHRINLRDQSQNQHLAAQGSRHNGLATLDLSAASDSVSWVLVRRVFRGTPLLEWMWATRSRDNLLPDGTILHSAKFAPMGSALCFPTECLVFAACIEYVANRCGYTGRRATQRIWSVYGDDLIVPVDWVEPVVLILERLGFIVNPDKSYADGPFRESCGKEYYCGVDVTPVYYRLPVYKDHLSPTVYMALCGHANLAFLRGLTFLRASYIDDAIHKRKKARTRREERRYNLYPPLFTDATDRPPTIYSPDPTNFLAKRVVNRDLQRIEYRYLTVSSAESSTDDPEFLDSVRYFEWLSERNYLPDALTNDTIIVGTCASWRVLDGLWTGVPRRPKWTIGRHPVDW